MCLSLSLFSSLLFSSLLFSPLSLFFIACCVARKTLTLPALDACIARLRCVARREKRHHRIETPGSRKNTRERGRLGKETHPRENKTTRKKREVFKGRKVEYRASSGPRSVGGPLSSSAWTLVTLCVCLCVRVFVCVMRARVSVCKNTEEEEDNNNKKKREKRISSHSLAKAKYRCLSIFYFILYSYNCARWIICDSMHPLNLIPTAFGLFHATWNTFTVLFNLVNVFGRSGEKRRLLVKDRRNDV